MLLCLYIHHIIEIKIYGFKINTAIYTSKNKIWDIFKKNKHFNNYIFHKKTSGKVLGTLYFFTKKNDLQLYEMSSNIQKGKLKFSS